MGSGFGYIEGAVGCTLAEILNFYAKNSKDWGTVCIHRNGDIVRKFDYDTFNNNIFYYNLDWWEYELIVKEVKFRYCWMTKDIDIYLD
jgi:hypothetical protein